MDKDDGDISGTVSFILSHFAISSAAASEEDELVLQSEELLVHDFMAHASTNDFPSLVIDTLVAVEDFLAVVPNRVVTNLNSYEANIFEHGIGIAIGFGQDKKIVSVLISDISANGSYKFNDSAKALVSFYKMSFILNKISGMEYRQAYVFNKGKAIKEIVTYASSAASVKITEAVNSNMSLTSQAMESLLSTYKAEVGNKAYTSEETDAVSLYLQVYYSHYSSLDPIQKTVLDSTLLHALRSNIPLSTAMLDLMDEFIAYVQIARPATLVGFSVTDPAQGSELIFDSIESVVLELIDMRAIPRETPPLILL